MSSSPQSEKIIVHEVPIELSKVLKISGVSDTGGAAKHAIRSGLVTLNGVVETRKAKKLFAGDKVGVAGRVLEIAVQAS